jgi:hypothetical protein
MDDRPELHNGTNITGFKEPISKHGHLFFFVKSQILRTITRKPVFKKLSWFQRRPYSALVD